MKTKVNFNCTVYTRVCFFGTGIGLFQALSLASELEEKLKLSVKLYFSAHNQDQWNTAPAVYSRVWNFLSKQKSELSRCATDFSFYFFDCSWDKKIERFLDNRSKIQIPCICRILVQNRWQKKMGTSGNFLCWGKKYWHHLLIKQ